MNKKSHTDLTQSQMLAKILPIESADMFFCNDGSVKLMWEHLKNIPVTTPCWSLSALLSFLPRPDLHQTIDGQWYCIAEPNRMYFSKHFDNPVDACVDMIVKLTEEF